MKHQGKARIWKQNGEYSRTRVGTVTRPWVGELHPTTQEGVKTERNKLEDLDFWNKHGWNTREFLYLSLEHQISFAVFGSMFQKICLGVWSLGLLKFHMRSQTIYVIITAVAGRSKTPTREGKHQSSPWVYFTKRVSVNLSRVAACWTKK